MITPLTKIRDSLSKNKLDAILISSAPNIVYLTNYPGFSKEEREAYLLVTKSEQYILTDGRYTQAVRKLIPNFKLIEISSKNPLNEIFKNLKIKNRIKKLGIEENDIKVTELKYLKKYFDNMYHYSGVHDLRTVKNKDEAARIQAACKLGDETFEYILNKIKLGISEKEVTNEIEYFIKKNGADISFKPIVAFGKSSAIPHHVSSSRKLKTDNIVLLDFGVKLNNYCSDMTRTIFFGKPTIKLKKMYNTVLQAQSHAIDTLNSLFMIHNSVPAKNIDKIARDYIISQGYPTIPHSLGHGIGLEVHEAPRLSPKSKDILKENMVFSVEPGIYLSNFGGVRIEDMVVLENNGPRFLTHCSKQLITL